MVEGYRLYRKEGLEPTPIMEAYLDEYRTNSDPVCQFVQSCVKETNTEGFIPVQEMLANVKNYCNRQGLDVPDEPFTRRRLRELLGVTVQRRFGHQKERTRGFAG